MNSEQALVFFAAISYFLVRLLQEGEEQERALEASQAHLRQDEKRAASRT